jgi:hypothetical protein
MQPHDVPTHPVVVTIGLKEIYDQLVALNTKVEVLMGEVADVDKTVGDHEERLRKLEAARWPLPALAATVSIAALVLTALGYFNRCRRTR